MRNSELAEKTRYGSVEIETVVMIYELTTYKLIMSNELVQNSVLAKKTRYDSVEIKTMVLT